MRRGNRTLALGRGTAGALLMVIGLWFCAPAFGETRSCTLTFDLVAGNGIGAISAGERLAGTIEFATRSSWNQDEETVSYHSDGTITVERAGQGAVRGQIRVVHVIRTPYTADYISIDAHGAAGDLGGRRSYADPMLVTLYAAPGTLASSELPRNTADWNQLSKRRVFQVHTPDAMATFYGDIENVSGQCS